MEIEPLSPNDAKEVKHLLHDIWVATYPNLYEGISYEDVDDFFTRQLSEENIEKFKKKIETLPPNDHYFGARVEGKIVGITEIVIGAEKNVLHNLAIHPDYQGQGIGYALWQKAYGMVDNDAPVSLDAVRYNEKALNFYKRLGFVEQGSIPVGEEFILPSGTIVPEIRLVLEK